MRTPEDPDAIRRHWGRDGLPGAVRAAADAMFPGRTTLTVEELAPLDQFHGGGLAFTRRLIGIAALSPGSHVLDVGGGLGGPARTIATDLGCHVTVADLAESYVDAGRILTSMAGLEGLVTHVVADALELPFADGSFDVVWTQNSGMNIAAKETLYAGFHRVLRPGGTLATQEPMAGAVSPRHYPLMWATDASHDHVRTLAEMRAAIEGAGFAIRAWEEVRPPRAAPGATQPAQTIQRLVMGDEHLRAITSSARANEDEGRLVMVQAVCTASG